MQSFDLQINYLNQFFKEMYEDQCGEFNMWIKFRLKELKGTCHEDIGVLSQFCAEVIIT